MFVVSKGRKEPIVWISSSCLCFTWWSMRRGGRSTPLVRPPRSGGEAINIMWSEIFETCTWYRERFFFVARESVCHIGRASPVRLGPLTMRGSSAVSGSQKTWVEQNETSGSYCWQLESWQLGSSQRVSESSKQWGLRLEAAGDPIRSEFCNMRSLSLWDKLQNSSSKSLNCSQLWLVFDHLLVTFASRREGAAGWMVKCLNMIGFLDIYTY